MDPYEVLGAFIDGERVDPDALKDALSTDEGRQYLIDAAALREMTVGDTTMAGYRDVGVSGYRYIGVSGYRDIGVSGYRGATARQRWLAPVAAAAAVVIALAGGYIAGRRSGLSEITRPTTIMATQPAPVPTSIIRLEPGVDWHEQTARN